MSFFESEGRVGLARAVSDVFAHHHRHSARLLSSAVPVNAHYFDKQQFVRRLEEGGFTKEEAQTVMVVLAEVVSSRFFFLL